MLNSWLGARDCYNFCAMNDPQLAAALRTSSPGAVADLFDAYGDRLFRYCRCMLRNRENAQIVVRDTLIVAAAHIERLASGKLLGPWLYSLARAETTGWTGFMTASIRDRVLEHASACPDCGPNLPRNVSAARVFTLLPAPAFSTVARLEVLKFIANPRLSAYREFAVSRASEFNAAGFPVMPATAATAAEAPAGPAFDVFAIAPKPAAEIPVPAEPPTEEIPVASALVFPAPAGPVSWTAAGSSSQVGLSSHQGTLKPGQSVTITVTVPAGSGSAVISVGAAPAGSPAASSGSSTVMTVSVSWSSGSASGPGSGSGSGTGTGHRPRPPWAPPPSSPAPSPSASPSGTPSATAPAPASS
jgi:hypothetical protein